MEKGCINMCMKNSFEHCEGFICLHVDKCIEPKEVDCNENCANYCNCSACEYVYDGEYDTCNPRPTEEEWMADGHFYVDENGNCRPTDR